MYYKKDPLLSSINYVIKKKITRIYNTNNTAPTPDTTFSLLPDCVTKGYGTEKMCDLLEGLHDDCLNLG